MRRVAMFLLLVAPIAAQNRPALRDYGRLPLVFEPNQGQADAEVRFLTRTQGGTLFLTEHEAVLVSRGGAPVRMRLTHAGKAKAVQGLEPTGGISNYFIGNDPAKWRTNIPNYRRVEYKSVYAGVDLVYYGNPQKLEYDLVVAPGADVAAIQLEYEGVESLRVDGDGDLVLETATGELRQKRPIAYQETASGRVEVKVGYRLKTCRRVAFELARYDAGRRLVIDPVLLYATYLGGSGGDYGKGIVVDSSGAAYITGQTNSTNFPTANPVQASLGGGNNVFVTKINAAGSALVYSTYLGGNGVSLGDSGNGIAVDGSGNAYVTGFTNSTNFPTANPLQAGNAGAWDAFVAKINPAGSTLVYSTYLGGSADDYAYAIAVDGSGDAYITGETLSGNFPTAGPIQAINNAPGVGSVFVTKINTAGSALVYSTYLGGSGSDQGNGIAVDGSGNAYVTGSTMSTGFPTASPLQASSGGGQDAFLTKVNAAGTALVYSTYLGGNGQDRGNGIVVDNSGAAFVTGYTASTNFPAASALQSGFGGASDAFVTKVNAAGTALVYSTYLGRNGVDYGNAIAVDSSGAAYVTGSTNSNNFPTANALQASDGGSAVNLFAAKIGSGGGALLYSTYLGGSGGDDEGTGIAVDGSGNAYVTGYTDSTNFPTANPLQASYGGGQYDVFVLSISSSDAQPVSVSPDSGSAGRQVFNFAAQDTLGANSIRYTQFLYSKSGISALNACYISYDPTANVFYLLSDDTTQWYGLSGGSGNNIGNAQCTIFGATSGSTKSGNNLTVNVDIGFRSGFAGLKNIYQFSGDTLGEGSGWRSMGTWSDTGDLNLVEIASLTPNSGGGVSQTFTAVVKEGGGGNTIAFAQLVMNTGLNGYNACFIHYDRASNVFYLLNDAGTGWSGLFAGSAAQVQNSQCILQGVGSGGIVSGSNLTITYNLSFTGSFTGARQIYMQAVDQAGIIEVWHQTASWTP